MEKVFKGWVLVDPAGEICSGCAVTKRAMLDSPIKSTTHEQVWQSDSGKWSGEIKMIVPRTFRDVWLSHYRKGYRFVRGRATVTTEV